MGIFESLIKEKCKYCACQECNTENCDNFAVVALREAKEQLRMKIEKKKTKKYGVIGYEDACNDILKDL